MTGLSNATLHKLPPEVLTPVYDRKSVFVGIAHIGVGNFHRAHQALYIDHILGRDGQKDWGIAGLGIRQGRREEERAEAFHRQDGMFTLTEFAPDNTSTIRAVGSVVRYVSCLDGYEPIIAQLADPAIRIVSLTITEGGYFVDGEGHFRLDDPFIAGDLKREVPESAFGLVTEALRRRRESGAGPFTVLCCDNLQHNGRVAQAAFCGFAEARDASLGAWIRENVSFPSCMVDRIAPSVTDEDIRRLDKESGVDDLMPVYSEDFIQWVIEDKFCAGRPEFEAVGVQMTENVEPYEQVKLRMLNAGHSVLAFCGLMLGYRKVDEAVGDARLIALLERFLNDDVAPLLSPPSDINLAAYAAQVVHRFRNHAVGDQLERIASDSFSKLPVFLGQTVHELIRKGSDTRREAFALACWAECECGKDGKGNPIEISEPAATDEQKAVFKDSNLLAVFDLPMFEGWGIADCQTFREMFRHYRSDIRSKGPARVLSTL
ncbi:mannitol dehydrogenase family protein [Acetobacter oeni]|uniref:Mannitol dehydrogenase n=1 Tax=Acetobacter oeni TaxID=304077 RepID=A0A511XGC3_9PROT|nr:mannitol dehydrogenase family protein [Acetobacter oeni]MBB3881822.1 mannitol 2-dehydrogenase [Acetobacter oeni]NHO17377.1 mannitol dehydrogenase family protein [Acetobacter oeni]GBR02144.1 NADPH-dependent L-sorbose reductase [Acetobacter oeni LMG 21952]GEN62004.1 mannitol dehydrogenase [Acetobacter oeni]